MVERLSTGLRNWLLDMGSMREAFKDCTLKIYSGAAPTSADDAVTGNLLVTITKASGSVASGSGALAGTNEAWRLHIQSTGRTGAVDVKVRIKFNRAGVATGTSSALYTFNANVLPNPTGKTYGNVKDGFVQYINDLQLPIIAVPGGSGSSGATGSGWVYVACRVPGDKIVISGATGDCQVTAAKLKAGNRGNFLYFNYATGGAISKTVDTWSGEVATTGVAGYFRIVQDDDDGTSSTSQIRLQGSVSTSGAELNLSNTSLTDGTTLTIDTFSVSLPAE